MLTTTSEYNYYNINLDETCNIVENSLLKDEQNNTVRCCRMVKVECIADFLDKKRRKKIIKIRSGNRNEELNKVLQLAKGLFLLIRIDKIKIIIERIVF